MRLKTFRAFTLAEALDAVHGDLGADAAILHTRTFRRGGFLGIGGREVVEVIALEARPETSILPAVTRPRTSDDAPVSSEGDAAIPAPPNSHGIPARARAAYSSTAATASAERAGLRAGEASDESVPSADQVADDAGSL